jgi:hypothetical protein
MIPMLSALRWPNAVTAAVPGGPICTPRSQESWTHSRAHVKGGDSLVHFEQGALGSQYCG